MHALKLIAVLMLSGCADELEDLDISSTCSAYCAQAAECDGDVDRDECEDNCVDAVNDCPTDDIDPVLDDLDSCADETCDDFAACTIGAGLECHFGI